MASDKLLATHRKNCALCTSELDSGRYQEVEEAATEREEVESGAVWSKSAPDIAQQSRRTRRKGYASTWSEM